ncbi:hypothetical protein H4R18_004511 [Coemansia javaensis]|uniref:Uncharacterized protein n=1 Tax=Coemansia javaensis TaxID=2761396 RepID=A0A9W8LER5_9FUNG|nr:hypothetical protein H4R18_004511 [Coemansia javaensis]
MAAQGSDGAQPRRNSFAGWPQSIFGIAPAARAQGIAAGAPAARAPAAARDTAASLPEADSGLGAFPGIGLFRRLSTSHAQSQPAAAVGLDAAVRARLQPDQRKDARPLPRALEGARAAEDTPPSRPDSRMRNLMLSGQFLV